MPETLSFENRWLENTYIYHDDIRTAVFHGCTIVVFGDTVGTLFEAEEHFLLPYFREIELLGVKGLKNFIDSEFRRALLRMPTFVQLCNKPIFPVQNL